jgi:DNA-binding LacI/PurR family transcriptional regulator
MGDIIEIAKEAGVSTATVSRVLNDKPHVKEDIREKVLKVVRAKHYCPKFTARRDRVAIIVDAKETIFLGDYQTILISKISKLLLEEKIDFEIIPATELTYSKESFLGAAIAIVSSPLHMKKITNSAHIPLVTINYPWKECAGVFSEHCESIKTALKYLSERGHRRIGMLNVDLESWGSQERYRGYLEGIKELDLEAMDGLFQIIEKNGGCEVLGKMLKYNPTAIIAAGEDIIMQTSYALYLLDKKIPDDISLIVYENSNICPYHAPPLTSISQNLDQLGESAVKLMKKSMNGGKIKTHLSFKDIIIERESVKELEHK